MRGAQPKLRRSSPGAKANLSTIQTEAKSNPRVSSAKLDQRGKSGVEAAEEEGAKAAGRLGREEVV